MKEQNPIALATQLGFTIAILIGGGAVLGHYIDDKFHTTPAGAIVGATTGLVLTFVYLFIRIRALPK